MGNLVLVIGAAEREQIAALRALAAANRLDALTAIAAADKDATAFREMMKTFAVFLPFGFCVVYSQEIQPEAPPPGLCHHISISIDVAGKLPSEAAVEMILHEFGMLPLNKSQAIWIEDVPPSTKAVNVVQLMQSEGACNG
jgi:hypothetical protein